MTDTGQSPNIVRDFTVGNTRIKIADDCCRDKTPEDVRRILKEIAQAAQAATAFQRNLGRITLPSAAWT